MPSPRPRLRLLTTADLGPEGLDSFYTLHKSSILHGGTIGYQRPAGRKAVQPFFEALRPGVESGDVIGVVAGNTPLDGFGLIRRDTNQLMRHCFELGRVMVRQEMQRHGLGWAIVNRLMAEAKRRKVEILWLDVRITNVPAIELFQKMGFRTWGIFPNRIKDGRSYVDALYMYCDLRHTYRPLRDLP